MQLEGAPTAQPTPAEEPGVAVDGYGDPDHDDPTAVPAEPVTPPSVPVQPPAPDASPEPSSRPPSGP